MKFNLKNYLATGAILAGGLFSNYLQAQENSSFIDSVMAEARKYPSTTHFMYELNKENNFNFHDLNKLEKIIEGVEKQCGKKEKYSREEAIEILKTTGKEIKNLGLEYKSNKFDCDDMSYIYLAVGEKFNLPLYGVLIPFHFFIRYDPDGKHNFLDSIDSVNKGDFNWETTDGKIVEDNKFYKKGANSIKKGGYLKNLTKQEL